MLENYETIVFYKIVTEILENIELVTGTKYLKWRSIMYNYKLI